MDHRCPVPVPRLPARFWRALVLLSAVAWLSVGPAGSAHAATVTTTATATATRPLTVASTATDATAPVSSAKAAGQRVRRVCGGGACAFYFSSATTQTISTYLDKHGWVVEIAAQIICVRVPNRAIAAACAVATLYPYARALPHLKDASEQGGCFVVRATVLPPSVRFTSVSPEHRYCG
ncbi:hypothetical protein [Streptosporangium carneum]|uniref:Uncharacterized protein n=1 Tax=Streptosporangium carneum TaxID=47481 RepID=A0A9W6I620_9ACTN|nr:hypothetical protein [Streptosporangium carneum]GLK12720.1 hypothetical protein GCM10017600_61300 [Streptosporangium carneum]